MEIILKIEDKNELKRLHKQTKDRKKADRIKTILLLSDWYEYDQIATILLLDEKTIRTIKKKYEEYWKEKFLEDDYVSYCWKLEKEEVKKVLEYVENNIIMDSLLIVNFIKINYNKIYTRQWIVSLLHREWFVYKKTKKVPSKANKEKQEEFIIQYNELIEKLTEKEKIYFMDWVHPLHNLENSYWWIRKGVDKKIKSNTGRDRVNLNWAYNLENQECIIIDSETINAQSTIELYKKIEILNPFLETIYVIRDNAKYYNNVLVKTYLETSKIKEVCLPTYSPNLNLIERLWLFFKKKITYNKYYEKFSDFKKVIMNFFNNDILYLKNELKSFITTNSMKPIWF